MSFNPLKTFWEKSLSFLTQHLMHGFGPFNADFTLFVALLRRFRLGKLLQINLGSVTTPSFVEIHSKCPSSMSLQEVKDSGQPSDATDNFVIHEFCTKYRSGQTTSPGKKPNDWQLYSWKWEGCWSNPKSRSLDHINHCLSMRTRSLYVKARSIDKTLWAMNMCTHIGYPVGIHCRALLASCETHLSLTVASKITSTMPDKRLFWPKGDFLRFINLNNKLLAVNYSRYTLFPLWDSGFREIVWIRGTLNHANKQLSPFAD